MKSTLNVTPDQPLDAGKSAPPAPRVFSLLALVLLMLPFLIVLGVPLSSWLGERRTRMICQNRMKAIATAIKLNATPGRSTEEVIPDLLLSGTLTPQDFTCPHADAPNYIFANSIASPPPPGNVPLITEPLSNHRDGGNVLWSDGHVEFLRGSAHEAARHRIMGLQEKPPP